MNRRRNKPPLAVQILDVLDDLENDRALQALWMALLELGACWECHEPVGRHAPNCEVRAWTR